MPLRGTVIGAFGVSLWVGQVSVDMMGAVAGVIERVGQPEIDGEPYQDRAQPCGPMAHGMDGLMLQGKMQLCHIAAKQKKQCARNEGMPPDQRCPGGIQDGRQGHRGKLPAIPELWGALWSWQALDGVCRKRLG